MCCFSRPVRRVSSTRVYARALPGGRQVLAYAMRFAADEDLAMVLPLPVPPGVAEDAVRFLDLSAAPGFFASLDAAWPPVAVAASRGPAVPQPAPLAVHRVGAFDASFVPSIPDFTRLDPRFRLDASVWSALGAYADWGFAVFKLRATRRSGLAGWLAADPGVEAHPMALTFPTRDPARVFFPTVHVHDGRVAPTAAFDHALYLQTAGRPRRFGPDFALAWQPSAGRLPDLPGGVIDPRDVGFRALLLGEHPNRDVWVEPGARPTAALLDAVVAAGFGSEAPAARALLATLPALTGEDPVEVALAALRPSRDGGPGPTLAELAARVRAFDRDALEAARAPAVTAWRRSGARYDPGEGARRARADEAGWEAWLAPLAAGGPTAG